MLPSEAPSPSHPSAGRTTPPGTVLARLHLDPVSSDVYRGPAHGRQRRLFGGLLLGQSVRAAAQTVDAQRPVHSIHGHFLAAGDGREAVSYQVERTRDGSSFSARQVTAMQGREVLFVATVSFHDPEPGLEYNLPGPPSAPEPESVPTGRYDNPWFESRDVPPDHPATGLGGTRPHTRLAWFRAREPMPDDSALHAQAIVYLTDHGPTRAVRQPHADHPGVERRMSVTLSHAVWLHTEARADEWLLSELHPVATGSGRGLAAGTLWTRDGRLVASVAQEALLRIPEAGPF